MRNVRLVFEVTAIMGLLFVAALAMPLMVLWLTYQWARSRKRCGH